MHTFWFQAGLRRKPSENQECTGTRQPTPLRVQEELGTVPRIQIRPAAAEIPSQCLRGLPADRYDAFLRALADAADEPSVEIDAGLVQAHRFADAQPRAVEKLDERAVTERARRRTVRGFDEPFGLRRRERSWKRAPSTRQVELCGRIIATRSEKRLVAEERADRRDP